MIIKQEPLSMAEVKKIVKDENEELEKFVKSFVKMKPEDAENMKKELEGLGILKIKPEHIVKIADLLPEDASDVNKICVDVGLDEEEIGKILGVVKKYK
jgi:DNA-directed RNA polymerase subunit F